ncbi:Rieske (2Fe-2S) protein [Flavobacterium sp. '19STA2R22 D10 B1']|uniref:Rieske (2Fe-2S) protein n=1 Tax=Flavobacterium aerium TaxID=3037261 RepID=UPI00278C4DA6|nr:hypothetical protein [Flavobacterium sp. '19STA2R22 D10 B1']
MKNILFIVLICVLSGCSKDGARGNNPYIPNYSFSIDINTNLPLYSGLNSPINPIYINQNAVGVKGIIVMKVSTTDYRAFEASCPNQYPADCSTLTIHGVNAKCPCDDKEYSLFTGVGPGEYPLKPYRVQVLNDNLIRVYN